MVEGRGSALWSARAIVALMAVSMLMLYQADYAQAVTYTVGESNVWTFNAEGWPNGKHFKAGDVLVFNYDYRNHNVVVVDSGSYKNCVTPRGARTYNSGKDRITLSKGQHFFICNFPGHCENAMKISVTASGDSRTLFMVVHKLKKLVQVRFEPWYRGSIPCIYQMC